MYKLYTDKIENFECKLQLEGASLSKAFSRIILETDDINLSFNGKIDDSGKCIIPIKKLRGLLDESIEGSMKLEVIAEDVYFQPWQSEFIVETAKRINVEVISQKKNTISESKPKLTVVNVPKKSKPIKKIISKKPKNPITEVVKILKKNGIDIYNISEHKNKLLPMLEKYGQKSGYKKGKFIREIVSKLAKT